MAKGKSRTRQPWRGAARRLMHVKSSGAAKQALYFTDDGNKMDMSLASRAKVVDTHVKIAAKFSTHKPEGMPVDEWLEKLFPSRPPLEERGEHEIQSLAQQGYPRAQVILKRREILNDRLHTDIKYVHKELVSGKRYTLRIYIGGGYAFFVERTVFPTSIVYRKSIEYGTMGQQGGMQRALGYLKKKRITWCKPVTESRLSDSSAGD